MNNDTPKKTNERPDSNYQEEVPKDGPPSSDHAVVQPEDKDYNAENADMSGPAKRKGTDEQPVNPIKTPPAS
jgi:hypothetical protein